MVLAKYLRIKNKNYQNSIEGNLVWIETKEEK